MHKHSQTSERKAREKNKKIMEDRNGNRKFLPILIIFLRILLRHTALIVVIRLSPKQAPGCVLVFTVSTYMYMVARHRPSLITVRGYGSNVEQLLCLHLYFK
jgi:hypothetical protein